LIGLDLNGVIMSWNPGAEHLLGYSAGQAIGQPVQDLAPVAKRDEQISLIDQAKAGKLGRERETLARRRDGAEIDVEIVVAPVLAADGSVISLSASLRDIAERKQADAKSAMLVGELDHRVKNILAIVSSLIAQTLKGDPSPKAFGATMKGRIAAITAAHNLLTKNVGEASLRNLVETELAPFHQQQGRMTIDNTGVDVALRPNAVMALAMTLHELASNAAKYGALSNPEGDVPRDVEKGSADVAG
jgi:two-component system CheB/CheR fusion protein